MLEPVSVGLKFAFLIVLYLFLLWISRSALKDLRRGVEQPAVYGEPVQPPADATGLHSAATSMGSQQQEGFEPRLVVERAPGHTPGMEYEIGDGEQRRAREVSVLVALALAAGVGALGVFGDPEHHAVT